MRVPCSASTSSSVPATPSIPCSRSSWRPRRSAAFIVSHFQANYKTEVVQEFGQALGTMALGQATPQQFVEMLQAVNK